MATDPQSALTSALMSNSGSTYPGSTSAGGRTPVNNPAWRAAGGPFYGNGQNPYYEGPDYLTPAGAAWEAANPNYAQYITPGGLNANQLANRNAMRAIYDPPKRNGGPSWVGPFVQDNPQYANLAQAPNVTWMSHHPGWQPYEPYQQQTIYDQYKASGLGPIGWLNQQGAAGPDAIKAQAHQAIAAANGGGYSNSTTDGGQVF